MYERASPVKEEKKPVKLQTIICWKNAKKNMTELNKMCKLSPDKRTKNAV